MRRLVSMFGAVAAVMLFAAACGGGSGDSASGGSGGGSGKAGVTITSPKSGASVTEPFTLKFNAPNIGPTDSGKDHVHVFVDGKENDYTVVTKNSFTIKGVPNGEHTINVTRQHADHSPTGAKDEIKVNITGGGGSSSSKPSSSSSSSSGGGYGY
jgi:hypothetical protein